MLRIIRRLRLIEIMGGECMSIGPRRVGGASALQQVSDMPLAKIEVGRHGGEFDHDGRRRFVASDASSRCAHRIPLTSLTVLARSARSGSLLTVTLGRWHSMRPTRRAPLASFVMARALSRRNRLAGNESRGRRHRGTLPAGSPPLLESGPGLGWPLASGRDHGRFEIGRLEDEGSFVSTFTLCEQARGPRFEDEGHRLGAVA
jgi:hypothetical protein